MSGSSATGVAVPDADIRRALAETLVVVPTLNEAAGIRTLLRQLVRTCPGALVVVADGGSTDDTVALAEAATADAPNGAVRVIHNPARLQAAAVNLAVARFGGGRRWLVRIDAHCLYPDDYVATLLREALRTGADSVVVAMRTVGRNGVQAANAAAQNSRLGNGGSAHRNAEDPAGSRGKPQWVDHGHHALMRMDAFRAAGGYDETFSHNEDAELDLRLRHRGGRILLTRETLATYFPRATLTALSRQYLGYGRGRARTMLKHRVRPRLRQVLPLAVPPALGLAALAPVAGSLGAPFLLAAPLALPALAWAGACALGGAAIALRAGRPALALSGLSAMIMHGAWATGFLAELAAPKRPQALKVPA